MKQKVNDKQNSVTDKCTTKMFNCNCNCSRCCGIGSFRNNCFWYNKCSKKLLCIICQLKLFQTFYSLPSQPLIQLYVTFAKNFWCVLFYCYANFWHAPMYLLRVFLKSKCCPSISMIVFYTWIYINKFTTLKCSHEVIWS